MSAVGQRLYLLSFDHRGSFKKELAPSTQTASSDS